MTATWRTPSYHSCCGGSYSANFVDGDAGTGWIHSVDHRHWYVADLGETALVTRIRIYQTASAQTKFLDFDVYVSDDPEDWGAPVAESLNMGSVYGWQTFNVTPKEGRYVYLANIDTNYYKNYIRGVEFQVEAEDIAMAQPYSFIM
jgi:alpha-L-fucosidase